MSAKDSIEITCAKCGRRLRVKAEAAGRRVRCPNVACGAVVAIPPAPHPDPKPPPPAPAEDSWRQITDLEAEPGPEPRRSRARMWVWVAGGAAAVVLAAAGLVLGVGLAVWLAHGGSPAGLFGGPTAGVWDGKLTEVEGDHKLTFRVSPDGKSIEGSVVSNLETPGGLTTSYIPFGEAPIKDGRFTLLYQQSTISGRFVSASQAEGEAVLVIEFGIDGRATVHGKWTARPK